MLIIKYVPNNELRLLNRVYGIALVSCMHTTCRAAVMK